MAVTCNCNILARRFQLTLNEVDKFETIKDYLVQHPRFKYIIACKENAPTTGHEHIHIYVCFNNPVRLSMKKVCPAHVEKCFGDNKSNVDYIRKDGNVIFEQGEMPKGDVGTIEDQWNTLIEQIHTDTVDKDSRMYARYHTYVDKRLHELKPKKTYDGNLKHKNIWISGPPATGKSRAARYCDDKHIYEKNINKWWDGYEDQKVVLIEDIDPEKAKNLAHHFKLWADRYPFTGEVKGGSIRINPTYNLIVTSNYSIDDCFNETDAEAIRRRMKEIEFK